MVVVVPISTGTAEHQRSKWAVVIIVIVPLNVNVFINYLNDMYTTNLRHCGHCAGRCHCRTGNGMVVVIVAVIVAVIGVPLSRQPSSLS